MESTGGGPLRVHYEIRREGAATLVFDVLMDRETLLQVGEEPADPPAWTALDFAQCPHCPLRAGPGVTCPVALTLAPVVEVSNDFQSYDIVNAAVTQNGKTITATTTAQVAFFSLMGLLIPTSGCPHTAFLRPMARSHMPFSSIDETVYRVFSMYLMAQYFRQQAGLPVDHEMIRLKDLYQNIEIVNEWMVTRLMAASETDASINAVICLDNFAKITLDEIDEQMRDLRYLFAPYLTMP